MKSSLKNIFLVLSLIPCVSYAGLNMPSKTIKNVIVNLTSGIHFQINETMENPDNCGNAGWYKIESDSKYEKEALSLLLSYQAQSKPITFYIDGCTGGYPKINYIF